LMIPLALRERGRGEGVATKCCPPRSESRSFDLPEAAGNSLRLPHPDPLPKGEGEPGKLR
jgi:hypothetical protein